MISRMRRFVETVAGNVAFARVSKPIRGEDSPARFALDEMPFMSASVLGTGTVCGMPARTQPFVFKDIQHTQTFGVFGSGTESGTGDSAGHLIGVDFIRSTLAGK